MTTAPFEYQGKTYRFIRRTTFEKEMGYIDLTECFYNVLQVKGKKTLFMWNWEDVEVEPIPMFAVMEAACLGSTTWRSELHKKVDNMKAPEKSS
jgi:hypothetical protein